MCNFLENFSVSSDIFLKKISMTLLLWKNHECGSAPLHICFYCSWLNEYVEGVSTPHLFNELRAPFTPYSFSTYPFFKKILFCSLYSCWSDKVARESNPCEDTSKPYINKRVYLKILLLKIISSNFYY